MFEERFSNSVGSGSLIARSCGTPVTPRSIAHQAPLSMDFLGKTTGVGCHFLFQGIFLTQGSNLGLLHCRQSPALQADSLPAEPSGLPLTTQLVRI